MSGPAIKKRVAGLAGDALLLVDRKNSGVPLATTEAECGEKDRS